MSTQNPCMEGPGVQQQSPVTSGLQVSVPSLMSHGAPTSCASWVETGVVVAGVEVPLQAARTNAPRHCTIRDLNMMCLPIVTETLHRGTLEAEHDGTALSRPVAKLPRYIWRRRTILTVSALKRPALRLF